MHTPLPSHTYSKWLPHTNTLSLLIAPPALRQELPDPRTVYVCVRVCACYVEAGTERQAELRLCDQIWNGRESHSSSCSLALRGSRSDRGQSQGHRGLPLLPRPFAHRAHWVICTQSRGYCRIHCCVCVCLPHPVRSEDEDEGALSASGPWPEEGVGPAGTRLWLCSALSIQEEAQSLPTRTGRCLYECALAHTGSSGLSASGQVFKCGVEFVGLMFWYSAGLCGNVLFNMPLSLYLFLTVGYYSLQSGTICVVGTSSTPRTSEDKSFVSLSPGSIIQIASTHCGVIWQCDLYINDNLWGAF